MGHPSPSSLRSRLEALQSRGELLNLKQAVGIVVPVAVEAADAHRRGEIFYLSPSALAEDEYGYYHVDPQAAARPPVAPRDVCCLAPELARGLPPTAHASVYALGCILYELVTGEVVGPGMRRPSEIVPSLPQELEILLSKALVADPTHRPNDVNALAQALYNLAPAGSIAPPPADTSHLDQDEHFAVDVSLSMLPPVTGMPAVARPVRAAPQSPYDIAVQAAPQSAPTSSQEMELSALKAQLEADRRPRYVVIKDGMDHGPFSAVELLQQIATHTFVETDFIRDSVSGLEKTISDWPEFARFAEHARIHRDIKAEKEALDRVVVQETRSTRGKAFLGIVLVGVLLAVGGVWFMTQRGAKSDEIAVQTETLSNIETDAGLAVDKKLAGGGKGRRGVVGTSGGFPMLGGGMSCEAAQNAYVEEMKIGQRGQADLTAGQYGSVLNRGSYFAHCGAPNSMEISICAAVQNGRAVGVSVYTKPNNPGVRSCISSSVRGLSFPSHPKLDVSRTVFK